MNSIKREKERVTKGSMKRKIDINIKKKEQIKTQNEFHTDVKREIYLWRIKRKKNKRKETMKCGRTKRLKQRGKEN